MSKLGRKKSLNYSEASAINSYKYLPGDVPQKRYRNIGIDEGQEGLNDPQWDDVIAKIGTVADNVAQCPHGLLANVLKQKQNNQQYWISQFNGVAGNYFRLQAT